MPLTAAATCFLGILLVSMVTGAPSTTRDQAEGVDQAESIVDRAKRADETIVFGNHQNRVRVVNKRSDTGDPDIAPEDGQADAPELGELDKGSEVIVHKETPVEQDLADRADAARKDFEDQGKIADAMEAAMESVHNAENDLETPEQAADPEPTQSEQTSSEAGDAAPSSAADESTSFDSSDSEEGEATGNNEANEDADIKDLLQVTNEGQNEAQAAEETTNDESSEQAVQEEENSSSQEETEEYPQTDVGEEGDVEPGTDTGINVASQPGDSRQMGDFWRQMYQYMDAYPGNARLPFDLYRRRRSSVSSKRAGSRRIKRDLLDDVEYDPTWIRYLYPSDAADGIDSAGAGRYDAPTSSVLDMGDSLLSDRDDYVPLTDSDAEDLYSELEEYLLWELQRRAGAERLREALGLASPPGEDLATELGGLYAGEADDGEGESGFLADDAYGPEDPPEAAVSAPYYYAAKRGGSEGSEYGLLPEAEAEKRYFFPFADEPETHWGAFVPEKREDGVSAYLDDPYLEDYSRGPSKRDYNEAIQRLQRLAMALSDNRGPYFTEIVQDQPYKK